MPSDLQVFVSELFKEFKGIKQRLQKFETWEPLGTGKRGASWYLTTPVTLASGAYRDVIYDTSLWNTDSTFSGGVFTFPVTGLYLITTNNKFTGFVGTVDLKILHSNGYNYEDSRDASYGFIGGSVIVEAVKDDTIKVQLQGSANIPLLGTSPYTTFAQIQLISSA